MSLLDRFGFDSTSEECSLSSKVSPFEDEVDVLVEKYGEWMCFLNTGRVGTSPNLSWHNTAEECLEGMKVTHAHIDSWTHFLKHHEDNQLFSATGYFLTSLIYRAYENGETEFMITMPTEKPLSHLGAFLRAGKERPLHITFDAVGGGRCGANSHNTWQYFKRNVGGFAAHESRDSTFLFDQFFGDGCGTIAKNCLIYYTDRADSMHLNITENYGTHAQKVKRFDNLIARKCVGAKEPLKRVSVRGQFDKIWQ